MTITDDSIRLGRDNYIFATLAINTVLIIIGIGIEEAIRARNWKRMSWLNYLDMKSVIVAASTGDNDT